MAFDAPNPHATSAIAKLVEGHEIANIIAPFVKSECDARSLEWRAAVAAVVERRATKTKKPAMRAARHRRKRQGKRRALIKYRFRQTVAALTRPRLLGRRLSQLIGAFRPAHEPMTLSVADTVPPGEKVGARYDKRWRRITLEQFLLGRDGEVPCRWGERHLLIRSGGLKRLYLLYLYRLVAALAPTNVLEIGCGAGLNIALMANRFPHVSFTGIELTQAGVAECRRIAGDALPAALVDFSPEPLVSRTAHCRARFHRGDAARLPYRDGSFDLVVTVLALEQMEHIREAALTELARVCGGWAVMIEPFRDWNADGERRRYVDAMSYLAAPVKELEHYGLMPVFATDDFPAKLNLGVGVVAARKIAPALRAAS